MDNYMILEAIGMIDDQYILSAQKRFGFKLPQTTSPTEFSGRHIRSRVLISIVVAAVLLLCSFATAMAISEDFREKVFDLFLEWIAKAQPDYDPAYIQTQLDNGQWVYMDGDNIAVIVPESPVKILLSGDAGETWRETVIVESKEMEFLGEWRENFLYRGGYIGFNGEESGYLVLTSGVSMNHQALRIFLTSDGGETWREIGTPYSQHISMLTGAGFSSENIGFISYRYYEDSGPDIWWTSDGGETWNKLAVELPEDLKQYNFTPQSPRFDGLNGIYPVVAMSHDPEYETTIYLYTDDGGMTWSYRS